MAFQGEISGFACVLSMQANEFRKIDLHRTAFTAIRATQTRPQIVALYQLSFRIQYRPFDHLPRGKSGESAADGTAAGAQAALHAVLYLFLAQLLVSIHIQFSTHISPSVSRACTKERISSANAAPSDADIHFSRRRLSSIPSSRSNSRVSSTTFWHLILPSR